MAHILIMPRQGNTVESCIITDWKVKEGDSVTPETTVCEVETDKASFEIPAGAAGTVLKLLYDCGDDVEVLKPIAVIGEAGENWQVILGTGDKGQGTGDPCDQSKHDRDPPGFQTTIPSPQSPVSNHNNLLSISPRARNLVEKEALPLNMIQGTGPNGRITERDVEAALQNRPALTAAAKAANPQALPATGSGLGGRITLEDIKTPIPNPQSLIPDQGEFTDTPIKGVRKIISDRMLNSLSQTAQFTLNTSARATKLQELRLRIKTDAAFAKKFGSLKITVNDLVLFAVSRVLPQFPYMNAHKTGDVIRTFKRVHLAVAVDTPKGLMVPVIRNADTLSLLQISGEAKRLAAACQNGTAKPDELSGSTFTISNLGSLGVTSFTPVLNAPEVAILGVCAIELKPVFMPENGIRYEEYIGLSLTINHQAVDGAPAAKFLKALCENIADIDALIKAG